jgi:NMD protein affecting ribosome stability and mRNA decay
VWRHEREHLRIRRRQAKREGKEILRAGVQVSYSICPECGRRYPTGGRAFVKTREGKEDKHPKVSGDFDILA